MCIRGTPTHGQSSPTIFIGTALSNTISPMPSLCLTIPHGIDIVLGISAIYTKALAGPALLDPPEHVYMRLPGADRPICVQHGAACQHGGGLTSSCVMSRPTTSSPTSSIA